MLEKYADFKNDIYVECGLKIKVVSVRAMIASEGVEVKLLSFFMGTR